MPNLKMQSCTWLNQLSEQLNIDIDCIDPAASQRFLPFKPHDQTSNQRLVYEQMISPKNRELFIQTVREGKDAGWQAILDRMSVLLCAKNIDNVQGRVMVQTSPFHAYDIEKVVAQARSYAREFEKAKITRDRFCIKIPCTGPALNACRILQEEGIDTLGTSLFSVPQAIAASQAGCLSISPYFNLPWYHADPKQWPNVEDPALDHPMAPRMAQIVETYRLLREETGKQQPQLKPASFISAKEALAIAEFGCEHATIPENILMEMSARGATVGLSEQETKRVVSARLAHLLTIDPLSGSSWDGNLPRRDIDYLKDGGAALTGAIRADELTQRGLHEALEAFKGNEMQSRAAIEQAMTQL